MAQCAPRLNGLSKPGSWPIQTPFSTSAITVQPTEQWVQTDLTCLTAPAAAWVCALARVTMPPPASDAAATPPAARPERLRKVRRSSTSPVSPTRVLDIREPCDGSVGPLSQHGDSPLGADDAVATDRSEAGELVHPLDVGGLAIALARGLGRRGRGFLAAFADRRGATVPATAPRLASLRNRRRSAALPS